jgi:hypothetical protein
MRVNLRTTALAGAPALGGLFGPRTPAVPAQTGPFDYCPARGYYATTAGLVSIPAPG